MVLHPALVAPELGGVDGHQPWLPDPAGERLGGAGDEPIVGVHQIEIVLVCELERQVAHVGVHRTDPPHEGGDILGELRLADAVDDHAMALLFGRQAPAATGQHVHLDAVIDEVLGELADVSSEATLDHRRVLPGDQQHAHVADRHPSGAQ